jgi:hypothetical protein
MKRVRVALCSAVPTIGLLLGLATHANTHLPEPYARISSLIGWTYFAAWSVSAVARHSCSACWPPPCAPLQRPGLGHRLGTLPGPARSGRCC